MDSTSADDFLRELARAPSQPLDPERIAHYRILGRIGKGGMGIVYRAEDEKLHRAVALKVLIPSTTDETTQRKRFLREARSAAALSHPNIAVVHEINEDGGIAYIAMELVEGANLRSTLEGGALSYARAIAIASQIARGLACAHAAGIVHRDLKPENVIIGRDDHVKIVDFGLAKPYVPGDDSFRTDEGRVIGTPAYMSPEQARGKAVTPTTDVFAFGVLLHEMLTGKRPFEGHTLVDLMVAVERGRKRERLIPPLDAILDRCLAKDSNDRFADASEITQALALASGASRASGRPVWLAIATALLVMIAGLVIGWQMLRSASTTAALVESPSPSVSTPVLFATGTTSVTATPSALTSSSAAPQASPTTNTDTRRVVAPRPTATASASASTAKGKDAFDRQ